MKCYCVICLVLLAQLSDAQLKLSFDSVTGQITYKAVVSKPSLNSKQLYKSSLNWVALHYYPQNSTIEVSDAANGYFKSMCQFKDSFKFIETGVYYALVPTEVYYTLQIKVSGSNCVMTLSGLHFRYYQPPNSYENPSDTAITVKNTFENQFYKVVNQMKGNPKQKKSWLAFYKSCDRRLRSALLSYKKYIRNAVPDSGNAF